MGQLLSGASLRNIFSSIARNKIGGSSDKGLEGVVAGDCYSSGKMGLSPFQYLPDSEATMRRTFMYHWWSGAQLGEAASTTDGGALGAGTGGSVFGVNTNSATYTGTSAQAGYLGQGVLTTGATTGNHAGFIPTPGMLSVANQIAVVYCSVFFPDPNVNAYDFYFGLSNKTIAPGTSGTFMTDGAVVRGITSAGALTAKLDTASNAANNDQATNHTLSATQYTQAVGVAQTVEMAIVLKGQASAEFWWRLPATASNAWNSFSQTTNLPRNSIVLRPHLLPVTRASAALAFQVLDMACWWFRPTTW